MNQDQFTHLCAGGPVLLDGATGTQLQQTGMPTGVCPELWVLDRPAVLQNLQEAYLNAGSSLLFAFTFGANRVKLAGHQVPAGRTAELNRQLAGLSLAVRDDWQRRHPGRTAFIAGDLAPTGLFLYPAGDLSFADLVGIYREQVRGQLLAGVDLFVIETMMDLAQTRAAVLAVQAECRLPVMASLTFEANGRTLAGNAPLECLIALASLGAAAFGLNCSFGPDKLKALLDPLIGISPIPLLAKPNAGMPQLVDGQTVFPMGAAAFAAAMLPLAAGGVNLLGGCCGTGPDHIARLAALLKAEPIAARKRPADCGSRICSARQSWLAGSAADLPQVRCADPSRWPDVVLDSLEDDPPALVIDLSDADADAADLADALQQLQLMTAVPLIFRCPDAGLLDALLRVYHGRAGLLPPGAGAPFGALYLSE